jgi:hypothetical protein
MLNYAMYDELPKHKGQESQTQRAWSTADAVLSGVHDPHTKKDSARGGRIAQPSGKGLGL